MKANSIHTWSVESEFVIKNLIFPWTSELAWIWHFLEQFGSFWALLYWQHWLQNWASKNAKFMPTPISKEKLNFLLQIQVLHFKYVWNLPSLSLARFFLIQNELRTMWQGTLSVRTHGLKVLVCQGEINLWSWGFQDQSIFPLKSQKKECLVCIGWIIFFVK